MGVYIAGMEMPTNADMAPTAVWVYPNGYAIVFKDNGKMKQYTEAVPVPPHGRLIDADALVLEDDYYGWRDKQVVKNAPTIIPADPAEEGE